MGLALNICLHILGGVLILIDFVLYLICLGPFITLYKIATQKRVFAKPFGFADINQGGTQSEVWRSVEAIKQGKFTETFKPGVTTAYEALCLSYETHASARAQGTRPLLKWRPPDPGFKFPAKVRHEKKKHTKRRRYEKKLLKP